MERNSKIRCFPNLNFNMGMLIVLIKKMLNSHKLYLKLLVLTMYTSCVYLLVHSARNLLLGWLDGSWSYLAQRTFGLQSSWQVWVSFSLERF